MPKPKFVKPLLIGLACAVPVGLIVGLSVNWQHTQFISAVGSSGVKPFIESFGKKYHEVDTGIDVTVESGGTTFAIEQLAQGLTNIGNASNNPYYTIKNEGYTNNWENKKTLTLGWEGLVLMYSLPKQLSSQAKNDFEIVINENNILQLYGIFSCIHEMKDGSTWDSQWESLWYYAPASVQAKITNVNDQNLLKNTKILPFVRSGGNTGANSSIAFSCYSNLKNFEDLSQNQQNAFAGGQYGSDNDHMETDESNSRAWQSFEAKGQPGSMVYLTTSFLNDDNLQLIKNRGYKLAKYGSNSTDILDADGKLNLDIIDVANQYNWFRPINIMVDIHDQKTVSFVKWIYDSNEYKQIVKKNGAKPLTSTEFATMEESGLLFAQSTTDIQLASKRSGGLEEVYGAIQDIWQK